MSAGLKAYRKQSEQITMSREQARKLAFQEVEKAKEEIEHTAYIEGAFQALLVACETLHDQHGFGKKRLQEFLDRFNFKMHCVGESLVTLDEMTEGLKALGLDVTAQPSLNLKEVPDVQ